MPAGLSLTQTATALAAKSVASFLAIGGTSPYVYSVVAGGAGGTIDPGTGVYTAPPVVDSHPQKGYDTIQVTDSLSVVATSQILVGTPLILFCDIIQNQLVLANGRVYLWDQKIMQPTDSDLYVAVSVPTCKPFASSNRATSNGGSLDANQFVSMLATLDVDIISRGPAARDRKEEVILALDSNYSRQQQEANSFYVGKISTAFLNLSEVDGAAIPYRYRISVNMQYAVSRALPTSYFDDFTDTIDTNS